MERFHSVRLSEGECKGCTNCIKRCPTEAIRVRGGKARINVERCIDCGECIRVCENHAKVAVTDPLARLRDFAYRVALPAPALFAQFREGITPGEIIHALLKIGFDEVAEVAWGADLLTNAIRAYLAAQKEPRPLISSACPAIVRLIQVRFPGLVPHLLPLDSPLWATARRTRAAVRRKTGLADREIGLFFLTPCPAKVMEIHEPAGHPTPLIDGALAIIDVYGPLMHALERGKEEKVRASGLGLGWGRAGGENQALGLENYLAVDGIHQVLGILEEIEMGKLRHIDYLEAQACIGGCVGGPLTVVNPFVARVKLRKLAEAGKPLTRGEATAEEDVWREFALEQPLVARSMLGLDEDFGTAMDKLEQLEKTLAGLPGLDCGSCGSPTCRALAEDIVQGEAVETDCVFKLRDQVEALAEELLAMARKVPRAMEEKEGK